MESDDNSPRVREVRQSEERFLASDVFEINRRTQPPANGSGVHREAARDVPIYH
jgi:hypothetical protein